MPKLQRHRQPQIAAAIWTEHVETTGLSVHLSIGAGEGELHLFVRCLSFRNRLMLSCSSSASRKGAPDIEPAATVAGV